MHDHKRIKLGELRRLLQGTVRKARPGGARWSSRVVSVLLGVAMVAVAVGVAPAVATASTTSATLFATPGGTGTSGCTSATMSPCSLAGAISAAGSLTGDSVAIELEQSTGSSCSASNVCTFSGTQSVGSGSEAKLTIEGTATGSGSSAYSVLDAGVPGTTFTDSATFPVKLSNVTVTGGSAYSVLDGRGGPRYYRGGGIYNTSAAPLTVVDSTISGNTTGDSGGGGIYNTSAALTVVDSTISGIGISI